MDNAPVNIDILGRVRSAWRKRRKKKMKLYQLLSTDRSEIVT